MIVQFSTGGRGRDPAARGNALDLRPDMASLSTGSVNFPTIVYENSATLVTDLATRMQQFGVRPEIELFDLSHIHGARRLIDAGLMDERPHVQVVMGVKNALPAEEHLLDLMLGEIRRVLPKATWTAAGHRREPVPRDGLGAGARRRRGADRARGQYPGRPRTGWPRATPSWCGWRPSLRPPWPPPGDARARRAPRWASARDHRQGQGDRPYRLSRPSRSRRR